MTLLLKSVLPVWILVAVAAVVIGVFSPPDEYLIWLPIALAASLILGFCLQLALQRKEGLVNRIMTCAVGCVVVLAIATAVLWPLSM